MKLLRDEKEDLSESMTKTALLGGTPEIAVQSAGQTSIPLYIPHFGAEELQGRLSVI